MRILLNIIIIAISILISSCKKSAETYSSSTISEIKNFELEQNNLNSKNNIIIKSPKATIDSFSNHITIDDTEIIIKTPEQQDIYLRADTAKILRDDNLIKGFGNIILNGYDSTGSEIRANNMIWSIDSSMLNLKNNIVFIKEGSEIKASFAEYNLKTKQIEFKQLDLLRFNKSNTKAEFNISAENALFDSKKNYAEFYNSNSQVISTFFIYK